MKIVRFSQNGHAPRLGCYLGQDRIADLEASATAFLASKGVDLSGEQQTKTRTALEFFANELTASAA